MLEVLDSVLERLENLLISSVLKRLKVSVVVFEIHGRCILTSSYKNHN